MKCTKFLLLLGLSACAVKAEGNGFMDRIRGAGSYLKETLSMDSAKTVPSSVTPERAPVRLGPCEDIIPVMPEYEASEEYTSTWDTCADVATSAAIAAVWAYPLVAGLSPLQTVVVASVVAGIALPAAQECLASTTFDSATYYLAGASCSVAHGLVGGLYGTATSLKTAGRMLWEKPLYMKPVCALVGVPYIAFDAGRGLYQGARDGYTAGTTWAQERSKVHLCKKV